MGRAGDGALASIRKMTRGIAYDLDFYGDFTECDPGDEDTGVCEQRRVEVWVESYKTVMKTANQSSCALMRVCESVLHSPRLMS